MRRNIQIVSLLIFIFLFVFSILNAKTYYLDSKNGNDLNSGLNPDKPWKHISRIYSVELSAGDSILLKSNGVWREEWDLNFSGNIDNYIFIGRYGDGSNPKILGSDRLDNWKKVKNNIWILKKNKNYSWIWFTGEKTVWGKKKSSPTELRKNFDFCIDSNFVYIYLNSDTNPNNFNIEASVRDFGIISGWYRNASDFIRIENLEICFTKNSNIRAVGSKNWDILNCNLHHSGAKDESDGQGIQWEGENVKIYNNLIYENGQHGIFISSFGNNRVKNNKIIGNKIYNNYHTGIDLMNDGGDLNSHQNTIIARNHIFDTNNFTGEEVGIQTLGYNNGFVKKVWIHHNVINNLNGIGISIVDNSDSIYIHNNTVVNTKSACLSIDNKYGYCELINNIGINNNYYAVLFLHKKNNLKIDYNIWFAESESKTKNVFLEDDYYSDLKIYQKKIKDEYNSKFKNPLIDLKTFNPFDGSPTIDEGKKLNYEYDFIGQEIDNTDIGAIEKRN